MSGTSTGGTKQKILELLERQRGEYISGTDIAFRLGLSRAAVWKAVQALIRDGHHIRAVTNRGYALAEGSSVLTLEGLLPYLPGADIAGRIHVFSELPSTNERAKRMAVDGCPHGSVVIADAQTQGRGRGGKAFYSPPGSGLYLSAVLRDGDLSNPGALTAWAAVAVCRAIESVCGRSPGIKWANDLMLDGKKIAGISVEAAGDLVTGGIDWAVIGVGVNIDTPAFPDELQGVAGSIFAERQHGHVRCRLAAEILDRLQVPCRAADPEIHAEYRRRLIVYPK